jgi:hypothetical protein
MRRPHDVTEYWRPQAGQLGHERDSPRDASVTGTRRSSASPGAAGQADPTDAEDDEGGEPSGGHD